MDWMWFIIYQDFKGLRDGRDNNYFLGAYVVVQIPGMLFFEKRSRKLMQVRHKFHFFIALFWWARTIEREAGDRYCLPEFVAQNGSTLKKQYRKLSETEKKNLTKDIEAVREKRMKVCRANPKAAQHDVNAAFSNMEHEVSWILTWDSVLTRFIVDSDHVTYWSWRFLHRRKRKCGRLPWTEALLLR